MRNLKKILLLGALGSAVALSGLAGCKSSHGSDRTQGRALDDKHITERVENALRTEPVYKFTDVDVKTFDGVVQLSGFVNSQEQKQRAGDLASGVQGVNSVVNSIALKPQTAPTGRSMNNASNAPVTQPTPATTAPPQPGGQ